MIHVEGLRSRLPRWPDRIGRDIATSWRSRHCLCETQRNCGWFELQSRFKPRYSAAMFGILNINKAEGRTSRDEVNVVQRLVKPAKVGHAGTLDPMATGVLLVCIGPATKLISLLQEAPKTYVAEFRFGQTSDTDDSTGEVIQAEDVPDIDEETFTKALMNYEGQISQVPPQYSAVKVDGKRAYWKARHGETMELKAKTVHVYSLKVLFYNWPNVVVKVECGSGTYIRSIVRDLGEDLGCGGLMSALERTLIGRMKSRDGVRSATMNEEVVEANLINPLVALGHLAHYVCDARELESLKTGTALQFQSDRISIGIDHSDPTAEQLAAPICLVDSRGHNLVAMAEYRRKDGIVQPRNVFIT